MFFRFLENKSLTDIDIQGPEHLVPQALRFMIANKIGILPYEINKEQQKYKTKAMIDEIDQRKIQLS